MDENLYFLYGKVVTPSTTPFFLYGKPNATKEAASTSTVPVFINHLRNQGVL